MFYFIYFELSDAGFREVCQRTCNIVPGGPSPSPICTVVPKHNIEKGNICQRNDTQSPEDGIKILKKETSVIVMTDTQSPEDGINEVLCTISTVSVRCSE
jgi:hypothetical protein